MKTRQTIVIALAATLYVGCAHSAVGPSYVLRGGDTVEQRVLRFRAVVDELRKSPLAEEIAPDLRQVEAWLDRVATRAASERARAEEVELLLESAEATLVYVKAVLGRREAERALALSRKRFESYASRVEAFRRSSQMDAKDRKEGL